MAVTEVVKKSATGSVEAGGKEIVRSYDVTYRIKTNDANDGPRIVMQGIGLTIWDSYTFGNDSDPFATFKGYTNVRLVSEDKHRRYWETVAKFDTRVQSMDFSDSGGDGDPFVIDDPLKQPGVWSGSLFQAQITTDRWADGTPIVNSARAIKALDIDDSRPTLQFEKNFAKFDDKWEEYRDAVNDGDWGGRPKGTVKVQNIAWNEIFYNRGRKYYRTAFSFTVNPDGWDRDFVDMGFTRLTAAGNVVNILDEKGLPVSEPRLLDGLGGVLADGAAPVVFPNPKKHVYQLKDFDALGIPRPPS